MASKYLTYGNLDQIVVFDDTDTYADAVTRKAARTDSQVIVEEAPTEDNHVLRKGDTTIYQAVGDSAVKQTFTASEEIAAWKLVTSVFASGQIEVAGTDSYDNAMVIGITEALISAAGSGPITTYGLVTNPAWTWSGKGFLFLGSDGLLTETAPGQGEWVIIVGFIVSATQVFINPRWDTITEGF